MPRLFGGTEPYIWSKAVDSKVSKETNEMDYDRASSEIYA